MTVAHYQNACGRKKYQAPAVVRLPASVVLDRLAKRIEELEVAVLQLQRQLHARPVVRGTRKSDKK